jgi:hypothetical protein
LRDLLVQASGFGHAWSIGVRQSLNKGLMD